VPNGKSLLVTEAEGNFQESRAISKTWCRELATNFFFLLGNATKEIHAILTETRGEHAP